MKKIGILVVVLCTLLTVCPARVLQVAPMKKDPAVISRFLTVSLEDFANEKGSLATAEKMVMVGGIPFQLIDKQDANAVSLKNVCWKDWQKDPSSFYSDYDLAPKQIDPSRVMVHIPVDQYSAIYMLANCDNSKNFDNTVTFRIGKFTGGHNQTAYTDFVVQVPRIESPRGGMELIKTTQENIFLVKVPLDREIWQDFKNQFVLDVDITKRVRLAVRRPDPCRFRTRPLGLPCGVRIYGLTFERAPVKMEVNSGEPGHIFNQPQVPQFNVMLTKIVNVKQCEIEAKATDYYGNITSVSISDINLPNGGSISVPLTMNVPKRGYYDLAITLKVNKQPLFTRYTSFALLPKDICFQ